MTGYELADLNQLFLEIWNKDSIFLCFIYYTLRQAFPDIKLLKAIGDNFPFRRKE